jgi:flagellar biosynthesis protein FliR
VPPELGAAIWGLVLAGARALPLCVLLSAVSRALVPWPVSLSLGLSLALGVSLPSALHAGGAQGIFAVARELGLGFAFAMAALLPILALGWAMRLGEEQLGAAWRTTRPLSTLYTWLAAFTFFSLSGHRALVMALSASLRDVPLGSGSFDRSAFAFGIAGFVADAFAFAVALAVPLLASLWIAGAALALAARALRVPHSLDHSLRTPLLVLLAGLLAAPLLARVPDAMRSGLGTARAVVEHIAH